MQATEIRFGRGVFWGVQYHPEIGLDDVAGGLRRQADGSVEAGLAARHDDLEAYAGQSEAKHRE